MVVDRERLLKMAKVFMGMVPIERKPTDSELVEAMWTTISDCMQEAYDQGYDTARKDKYS